jgi:hypothetical protein
VLERVGIGDDGLLTIIGVDGAWANPDGCDASYAMYLPTADESGVINDINATLAAAIIAAKLKGTPISFYVNGCIEVRGQTFPRPRSLNLR